MASNSGNRVRHDEPTLGATGLDVRQAALLAVTLAMLAIVLLPLAARIMPVIYFDVDPRSETGRQAVVSLGPTGAAWWHVLGVLVAAAGMGVHRWLGGRIRWGACALAAVGVAFCAWQMPGHFDNRLHGGAWIASVSLALAAAHLAAHEIARRWLVAGLVAMLVPLLLDALWYVLVTHPQTVQQYEQDMALVLDAHGFERGSSQHLAYEDRLRATHATGPFGMSNIFGTVAASLTVLGAGLAAALWTRARPWAFTAAAVAVAVGGLITSWLTESRGALLALPMGLLVMALTWLLRGRSRWRWMVPTLAIALVVAAFGAVLMRGAVGPPDTHEGERSLLFRAHYWEGAARMIGEHLPQSAIQGVGPAGFRAEYLRFKNPVSPENVTSAHNVFVDYITMLGVGGAAWSALLLLWLWQAGRGAAHAMGTGRDETGTDGNSALTRGQLALAVLPSVAVFGTQYLLELPTILIESALLWLGGALAFICLAAGFALPGHARRAWLAAGLFGAAVVLLVHNQIEMSFFQIGSSITLWVVVGLAAGAGGHIGDEANGEVSAAASKAGWLPAGALGGVTVLVLALAAAPITAHQRHMAAAVDALQADRYPQAIESLDAAGETMPREDRALRWRVRLRIEIAQALADHNRPDAAASYLAEAAQVVADAETLAMPGPRVARQRAGIEEAAAELLEQPERLHDAITATRRVIQRSPYNLNDRINLGDLYWRTNQRDEAIEQYRAAMRISEAYYLEPLQQLTVEQREHLEQRLRAAGAIHEAD